MQRLWNRIGRPHGGILLLCIAVAVVFGRSLGHEFLIWDDRGLIIENPIICPPSWAGIAAAWRQVNLFLYIPVTYTFWIALAAIGQFLGGASAESGIPPWPFHLANMAVHLGNVLLVYRILRQLKMEHLPAAIGCVLFALHPMQVEAVAWATGMKDLLSTFLALGGVTCYLSAAIRWSAGDNLAGHRRYRLALVALVAASLAKPGIVGIPLLAGILDILFISGFKLRVFWRVAGLGMVLLPAVLGTYLAQYGQAPLGLPVAMRPAVACHALAFYLRKLVFPDAFCVDYGMMPMRVVLSPELWTQGLAVPLLLFGLLLFPRQRKYLAGVLGIMVAGILPVLGLVGFLFQTYSTVTDRYFYVSMFGASLGLALVVSIAQRRLRRLIFIVLIIGLGGLSLRQVGYWRDTLELCAHCVEVNPRSWSAYGNMGLSLCPTGSGAVWRHHGQGVPAEVRRMYAAKALEYSWMTYALKPNTGAICNLVYAYASLGDYSTVCRIGEWVWANGHTYHLRADVVATPYDMAEWNLRIGNPGRAAQWLICEIVNNPKNQKANELLALVLQPATTQPTTIPSSTTSTTHPTTTKPSAAKQN